YYTQNVLHLGAEAGRMDIVKYCVEECKMNVTTTDHNKRNVFHLGAQAGSMDIVKYCVEECKMDVTSTGEMLVIHFRQPPTTTLLG
ncbi:hypothetical protein DXG01_010334, partial [Tephrocybe rancida]